MSKNIQAEEIEFAGFTDRLKAAFMDYIGPWLLFFVGAFVQTPLAGIGIAGIILGAFCELLGIVALLFINGYAPALNRGFTPNKMTRGLRLMKIVNKETMELREINEGDLAILLIRAFIGWFEMFLFFPIIPGVLVAIIMSINDKNQRLADMIAGTVIIKVEPVEKVNIKDFRLKKSDPPPTFDGMAASKTEKGTVVETGVPSKKVEKVGEEGVFTNPSLITAGKWIFICSAIYLILAQIVHFVSLTLNTVNRSFLVFGGDAPIDKTARQLDNVLNIIGCIILFINLAGLLLYYFGIRNKETKKPLLISSILYLLFIICWIVYKRAGWPTAQVISFVDFSLGYTLWFYLPIGGFVFDILGTIFLVTSLFFLRKFVKNFNEEHQTNVRSFFGQITLIVFFSLLLIASIMGLAHDPFVSTPEYNIAIYYLVILFRLILTFVYLGIFASFIKLRKIANINNQAGK